jgi:branched-chain amino acid transport system substrate-binding protein
MTTGISRRGALAGAGLLAAHYARPARAQRADSVRIGVLNDQGGPFADSGGAGSVLAANMAVQDFGGTVLGKPIDVLSAATQNKPDIAGSVARQWYDSGVDVIVDLPVTPIAAAVQQIAREKSRSVMIAAATANELTTKTCSAFSSHWVDDTHSLVKATTSAVLKNGGQQWFFVTVDYSFGHALQAEAAGLIEAAGGRVIGSAAFPLGNTDFSAQLVSAQSSGAKIVGLAAVGLDQVNLIKQAGEFGLVTGGKQTLAGFLVYISDIHALGLAASQGLTFGAGFYWDQSEASRRFAKRFQAERQAMPTKTHAAVYTSCLHFLRAMQQAGTRDALAVNKAMRTLPVENFGRATTIRADGRAIYDLSLYRVKSPASSSGAWDYYEAIGSIPAAEAFLPMRPDCERTT